MHKQSFGGNLDRFKLEGVIYRKQRRKCGKPECVCMREGQLHGGYWYARDTLTGEVTYIGRELPREIARIRETHKQLLPYMTRVRRSLLEQAHALAQLMGGHPLSAKDKAIAERFGFGAALIPSDEQSPQEEKPSDHHPLLTTKSWKRLRRRVKERDEAICQYCGQHVPRGHVDHVIPLSQGGTDELDNLVWDCPSCNNAKGTGTVRELERSLLGS